MSGVDDLLTGNPIWQRRLQGVANLDLQGCLALGVTGPILRSAGLPWDLRKVEPYCGYEGYDFDVPVETTGDGYGRFLVRVAEIRESLKIIEQALDKLVPGPVMVEDTKIAWPAQLAIGSDGMGQSLDHVKKIMGTSMEALIHHFKLVTEGFRVPPGQVYVAIESPRGELGLHVVSDGGTRPYRVHVRDPSFVNLQAVARYLRGRPALRHHRRRGDDRPRHGWSGPLVSTRTVRRAGHAADHAAARRRAAPDRDDPARGARDHRALPQGALGAAADAAPRAVGAGLRQPRGHHAVRGGARPHQGRGRRRRDLLHEYRRRPAGTYHVGVCTNTLCAVLGGDAILDALKEHLGIGHNETREDGTISLEHLECNAACDYAPVVMVNWEFYDDQTPSERPSARRRPARGRPGPPDPRAGPPVHVQGDVARARRLPRRPRDAGRPGRSRHARGLRARAGARRVEYAGPEYRKQQKKV